MDIETQLATNIIRLIHSSLIAWLRELCWKECKLASQWLPHLWSTRTALLPHQLWWRHPSPAPQPLTLWPQPTSLWRNLRINRIRWNLPPSGLIASGQCDTDDWSQVNSGPGGQRGCNGGAFACENSCKILMRPRGAAALPKRGSQSESGRPTYPCPSAARCADAGLPKGPQQHHTCQQVKCVGN